MAARENTGERIARLEEKMAALADLVKSVAEEVRAANDSRRAIYSEQAHLREGMIEANHRLDKLQSALDAIKPTSEEYARFRERVIGAGTFGRWAWRVGGIVIAGAGWAAAAYTAWTGRPPP